MKYLLVAIKDLAIQAFQPPMAVRALGEATRGFTNAVNDPNAGHINKSPQDFELYHIGNYDDQTAQLEAIAPERIARATDVKGN